MSLMDGKLTKPTIVDKLNDALLNNNVRQWGVINLDTDMAEIRCSCRRCGAHGEFPTRQLANAFITHHRGANGKCPHEDEIRY